MQKKVTALEGIFCPDNLFLQNTVFKTQFTGGRQLIKEVEKEI